ncbi:MAG: tripartite tricarboxylate transporter substrate binding protein [Burkholderiales bacterium]|nr:tripartite tricarboxylate transporter substrate binding protein [Burkholderiales bacterium]
MKSQIFRSVLCAAIGMAGTALAVDAQAQIYPARPIRMICPFPPGGTTDVVARLVAQRLTEAWGQQAVVDNRPGAGGIIGTEIVAKATPDGHTVLLGSITTHAVNPALYKKLSFDPVRDFAPVSLVVSSPQLLAVHPSVAAKSVKDLLALAKAKPGQLNYASAGAGTSPHLTFELFKSMAGIDVMHVPYKGTGPAITDLLGGQVQMMITGVVALMPHVKSGKLRGLGVTSAKRVAALPDLPTVIESGITGFDVNSWFGVFLPGGTPKSIVTKMNAEIQKMLAIPEVRQRLTALGADPAASNTPEEFAVYIQSEMSRWGKVVRDTGARAD